MIAYDEYYEVIRGRTPAAGVAFTQLVPGESWFRILAVRFTLTNSAVAANRFATLDLLDGDQAVIARSMSPNALTATLVRSYTFIPEASTFTLSAGGEELGPTSCAWLQPGIRIRITVANIDAGDQINAVSFYVGRSMTGEVAAAQNARPWFK